MPSVLLTRRAGYFASMVTSLLLLLFSLSIFAREAEVLTYGTSDNIALHNRIHKGLVGAAYSEYANKRLLLACNYALGGIRTMVNTHEYNVQYAGRCRAIADDVLKMSPTNSFAHAVRAQADVFLGDFDAMNADLIASQKTAPNEQWIAQHRNPVAEANYDRLDEATIRANDADLALLVVSSFGISAIAQRYWNDESFRERITAIVEKLPAKDQRRFIRWVRNAARRS